MQSQNNFYFQVKVLVIHFGTCEQQSYWELAKILTDLVDVIRLGSPQGRLPKLLFSAILPRCRHFRDCSHIKEADRFNKSLDAYNEALMDFTKKDEHGRAFIRHSIDGDAKRLFNDSVHLSHEGGKMLAKDFQRAVFQALRG